LRKEFPKSVKREALKRSGGLCEAVGELYGLEPGVRCNANLAYGVHFDHVNGDSNGGKPTLDNCAATCPRCNQYKNNKYDTPRAAKGLRQQDKALGIVRAKGKIKSRGFQREWVDNTKYINVEIDETAERDSDT